MSISPARAAAFETLMRVETTDAYASELLHSARFAKLSSADHGLLTELVMGVLRWRGTLDEGIARHSRQPLSQFDIEVLSALRIGAYQILFLTRIPAHAAINESVELVKCARKSSAAGMVNAVLRKIASHSVARDARIPGQTRSCHFSPNHPQWLIERWQQNYGVEAAEKICAYDQAEPQTAVRVTNDHASASNQFQGIQMEPGRLLTRAAVATAGNITSTQAFRERRLVIQDEASQLVPLLVGKGKRILDACAAPGGKTRILSEKNPGALLIAMEIHPRRAALLRKLVPDVDVKIIVVDARLTPFRTVFDRILVDAPCSGTGTLARIPEIKWRLKPEDLARLQAYQFEILSAAMQQAASGGRVVYSTCSLEPEENEQVIEKALAANSEFRVVDARNQLMDLRASGELGWHSVDSLLSGPYLRTIPGMHPCDGFFAAILERTA